jgi:hypothetical protein
MKYKHSKEKQKEVLKKYELGGSTGLPAGAEQHYVNHYLNEGASVGIFANGGGVEKLKHFPLDKEKLNKDAKWYADRIKSGSMSTTKKSIEDDIEEYKKDLYLLEIGKKRPSNIIGTGYKGDTKKIAYTWLLEQIYLKNKILELLKDFNNYEVGGSLVDGYLTDPNFGDFQAGIYDNGGQIDTKNITIAKRIKVKKWYLKTYPKDDLGKEIREDITFWSLWAYMSQGYDVYNILGVGDSMIRERVFEELSKILGVDYDVIYQKWLNSDEYAMGGSLGNHGLKQGDQIIKTMSGGVQKVKTKSGDIVYVNLANGYRGAEPPLPFDNGGSLKKQGRYSILGEVDGEQPVLYATTDDRSRINSLVDMAEIDFYELTGKKHNIIVTDELTDDEVYNFDKGGRTRERKYVNYSQKHEVRYSKDKPHRRGYGYENGGGVDNLKRFDVDFYKSDSDNKTSEEKILRSDSFEEIIKDAVEIAKKEKYNYIEIYHQGFYIGSMKQKDDYVFKKGRSFDKNPLSYATGGVTKNYINRNELNTITIKKGDQKLTYKVSDVYNGAYKLENGGNLEKMAFYVPKRNVVKVQLRSGKDVKVANGYWIKKGAKPIHTSKYDDGGMTQSDFMKKEIESQREKEKGKTFKDFKVNVYEQSGNKGAYPFVEPHFTDNFVEALNFAKETIKKQRNYRSNSGVLWATIDSFTPIEKRQNVRYAYDELVRVDEEDINSSKYDDGGQLEMKFAGGGKIETKIQKKVDEVNALIEKAIDSDGDPIMVVDKTGTWEEPMQYKPIIYKNGRLYIEYFEPYSGKTEKEVINKSNVDFDGYPTLLNIAKMYRKALKEKGISYSGGGKTTFKEKATAIAKKYEGKKVKPKYQKEYGKTYDKAEAKEVGNKIAGSQKAKYDSKMSGGGSTKRKPKSASNNTMVLAKQIRKDGESWQSAMKRAKEQIAKK